MPRLSLSFLGPFQVFLDGLPETSFDSSKVRALLAYVAVEGGRPHPRDVLADMLWPDRSNADALSNLRYALYNLRNAIGDREAKPSYLLIDRSSVQLNERSDYVLDVAEFERLTEEAHVGRLEDAEGGQSEHCQRLQAAVALWQGSFLEGFSVADSPRFEEWALLKREQLCRRLVGALKALVVMHERCGEYNLAIQWARRQIEAEPWNERVHRKLMRLLVRTGERGAAVQHYEACRRLMRQSVGLEPTEKTRKLLERIKG